jgi:hypothetical protein
MDDMGSRAAIVALSALLVAGCSGEDRAGIEPDMSGVHDMGVPADGACTEVITITSNPGPDVPGGFVYVPADLYATTSAPFTGNFPAWTVILPDGSAVAPEIVDTASGLSVKLHAVLPGSYIFRVSFGSGSCGGTSSFDLHTRDSNSVSYRLRISPPDTAGIPQQDQVFTLFGGTPQGAHDLSLSSGTPLQGTLVGPGAVPVVGEVRLVADSGPDALALASSTGAFFLSVNPDVMYTPLIIPSGAQATTLAPRLLAKATGAALTTAMFVVDAGQSVSGTIIDPSSQPIAGAKVVLRSGQLPSGIGLSVVDGSYSLRAEPGDYVAFIAADGWPEISLPSVTVQKSALSLDVQYLVTRVAVNAKVVASDGTTAVAGARITIKSPLLSAAATVNVGGVAQSASARAKQVAISAKDGSLPLLQLLPLASDTYDVLIEPPAGSADGVTRLQMPLSGAGNWTLQLQPKLLLSGVVTNLVNVGIGNVKVTAFERAGLGAAPSTTTSSDGKYALRVDPGSALELVVQPPASVKLAGVRLPLSAGVTQANAALLPGLQVGGYVIAPGGGHLPSVVIDALCGSCGSVTPVASTISDPSGSYALYLPDPGLQPLDGGVDASP